MKKTILAAVSVLLLVLTSCYDEKKDSKVRIYLGNVPFAARGENRSFIDNVFSFFMKNAYAQTVSDTVFVDDLHIAVYAGNDEILNESIAGTEVAVDGNSNSYIEIEVPSGSVTILVVGEYNSDGVYANYMGFNKSTLAPGVNDVTIAMKTMSAWASSLSAVSVANTGVLTWTKLDIPVKYVIEDQVNNNTIVYEGDGSSAGSLSGGCNGFPFTFYLKFEQFGITSSSVDTVSVYDSNQC